MIRELLLLRHAKSIRLEPAEGDSARPLTPQGETAGKSIGRMMAHEKLVPDRVLCSPAVRARQTLDLVSRQWPHAVDTEIVPALYDFGDGSALLDVIRRSGGTARRLMLVGHNPSMENLAHRLATAGDERLRARMAEKYPTAALAVIAVELDGWDTLKERGGTLTRFIRPRDLED